MSKREYSGLVRDESQYCLARIRVIKDVIHLVDLQSIDVHSRTASAQDPGEMDYSDELELLDTDVQEYADEVVTQDDDSSGVEHLRELLGRNHRGKVRMGLALSAGETVLEKLHDTPVSGMNKKERKNYFEEKLRPAYGNGVREDQYACETGQNGTVWLNSHDYSNTLLAETDRVFERALHKVRIREMLCEEAIWAGLVRSHYRLDEQEITALVGIGEKQTRMLFLRGGRLEHVLPIINEPARSPGLPKTIFSKLLFEVDKGTLAGVQRVLIMRSVLPVSHLIDYFETRHEEITIEAFTPSSRLFRADEVGEQNIRDHSLAWSAIGAAVAAREAERGKPIHFPQLSLLPAFVRERQKVFRLQWHGVLLLILIALTPVMLFTWHEEASTDHQRLAESIQQLEMQVQELQAIAEQTDLMTEELTRLTLSVELLEELSEGTGIWSAVLQQINDGSAPLRGLWLTTLQVQSGHLTLDGYSMYRTHIPRLAAVFPDAHIVSVTQGEMRDRTIYRFTLQIRAYEQLLESHESSAETATVTNPQVLEGVGVS